jgi:hypothetical protein
MSVSAAGLDHLSMQTDWTLAHPPARTHAGRWDILLALDLSLEADRHMPEGISRMASPVMDWNSRELTQLLVLVPSNVGQTLQAQLTALLIKPAPAEYHLAGMNALFYSLSVARACPRDHQELDAQARCCLDSGSP